MSGRIYFEDLVVGAVRESKPRLITRGEIVEFATQYDPQPFHLDDEAAKASPYGGLIASGWHTAAIAMRLSLDALGPSSSMGSPGVDELRWLHPVRPGDALTLRSTLMEAKPSSSKPDRGSVKIRYELLNQDGKVVLTMTGWGIFGRRPASG